MECGGFIGYVPAVWWWCKYAPSVRVQDFGIITLVHSEIYYWIMEAFSEPKDIRGGVLVFLKRLPYRLNIDPTLDR